MISSEHKEDVASGTPEEEGHLMTRPPLQMTELGKEVAPVKDPPCEDMLSEGPGDVKEAETSPSLQLRREANVLSSLTALMDILDSDQGNVHNTRQHEVALRSLQKMCMRVPQLSNELTRPQRFRLYCLLLIEDNDSVQGSTVSGDFEDWTVYRKRALEAHVHVAKQAVALFRDDLHISSDELAGLFYRLGAETGFYFSPEMTEIILCITYVVAGSRLTEKDVLLRALFRMLCVLQKDFLVSASSHLYDSATASLLRLMLQFFDPQLVTHLDQQQVNIGKYLVGWSRRLLVLHSDYETALKVLDWVFILGDPVMVPFVAHAYLITYRQTLLSLCTNEGLNEYLDKMRFTLPSCKADAVDPKLVDGRATAPTPVWSGKSLLQNADLLYRVTPLSTQRMLDFCLYPDVGAVSRTPEELQHYYDNSPCLPLERSDIAAAFAKCEDAGSGNKGGRPQREYIILDCRSQESFDYLRLPTAVLVGDVLGFHPEDLSEAMRRLESCRGHPLAIFGTGRPIVEEINLLKVFALYLVNRNAFPFVCVVPGGLKTTIPLIHNDAIHITMSTAAAVSLQHARNRQSTSRFDLGQQASNTAHSISAALRGVSDYLAQVEKTEVRQKAEELGMRVKVGVTAAKSWGLGWMQRVSESLGDTREHALTVLSSVAKKHRTSQAGATMDSSSAPPATTASSSNLIFSTSGQESIPTATAHPDAAISAQPAPHIFSLGDDGDEEDLDLITEIPARPVRGVVVAESVTVAGKMVSTAPVTSPLAAGDASAGQPHPPASTMTNSTTATTRSPDPVGTPTSSGARGDLRTNPAAFPSQIAASIDAEFDELFGDLDVGNPTTTGTEASSQ